MALIKNYGTDQKMRIMKTIFGWTAGILVLGATLTTHGGLIAAWTLEGNNTLDLTTGINKNGDVTYDPGLVTGTLTGAGNASMGTGGAGVNMLNDPRTTPINSDNLIYAGINTLLTIQLNNVAGLSGFTLTYAAHDTLNGTQGWQWSNNGVDWANPDSSTLSLGSTWSLNTVDFSSASGSTMYFKNTLNSGFGFAAFDNFQVNAVPEPSNYALAAFGLCICFGWRFIRKLARA
jgi:hypothetical protein